MVVNLTYMYADKVNFNHSVRYVQSEFEKAIILIRSPSS